MGGWKEVICKAVSVDRFKLESLARLSTICVLGTSLAVADLPNLVPPSTGYMIGVWACTFATSIPKLVFILLGVLPSLLTLVIISLGFTTALLASNRIDDDGNASGQDWMVVFYAAYSILIASFFFGKDYQKTSGYAAVLCLVPGMLAVSYLPLLQNGIIEVSSALWTATGINNSLAVVSNLLITIGWVFLTLAVGVLLPPLRTARRLLTRTVLPGVLTELAEYTESDERTDEDDHHRDTVRRGIQHTIITAIHGKALLTVFEPRLWRNENLVQPLGELLAEVESFSKLALLKDTEAVSGGESYPPTIRILQTCAKALRTNDPRDLLALKQTTTNECSTQEGGPAKSDNSDGHDCGNCRSYLTEQTYRQATKVRDATVTWLEDLNSTRGNSREGQAKNHFLVATLPLMPIKQLLQSLRLLCLHPKKWNWRAILWVMKYSAGYVLLFCLSIYVPAWRNFGIGTDKALYSGWHLLAYAFAWMPTVEGTAKTGVSRFSGTLFGALCAWVGIITCSLSYVSDGGFEDMNSIAVVLWITYFSALVTYFATDDGPSSMFGSGYDLGAFAKYFAMTLSLIMLEVHAQLGTKNEIVVNRLLRT